MFTLGICLATFAGLGVGLMAGQWLEQTRQERDDFWADVPDGFDRSMHDWGYIPEGMGRD